MYNDNFIISYVRTDNCKNYIILYGARDDFRVRQRSKNISGEKYPSLKFSSFREIFKNENKIMGIYRFNAISRL